MTLNKINRLLDKEITLNTGALNAHKNSTLGLETKYALRARIALAKEVKQIILESKENDDTKYVEIRN